MNVTFTKDLNVKLKFAKNKNIFYARKGENDTGVNIKLSEKRATQ